MNGGKILANRGLWMKGDKRWIIYHDLPSTFVLLFTIINDVYDMSSSYR